MGDFDMPTPAPDHRNHGPRDRWAFLLGSHIEPTEDEGWRDYVKRSCDPSGHDPRVGIDVERIGYLSQIGTIAKVTSRSGKGQRQSIGDAAGRASSPKLREIDRDSDGYRLGQWVEKTRELDLGRRLYSENRNCFDAFGARKKKYDTGQSKNGAAVTAAIKRDKKHTALSGGVDAYIGSLPEGANPTMAGLVKHCFPTLKHCAAKKCAYLYREFILALFANFKAMPTVVNMMRRIDAVRAGVAKKAGKPRPASILAGVRGVFTWRSGSKFHTKGKSGFGWNGQMKAWVRWICADTGEILQ